jgi:hypothetical protein
MDFVFKGGGWNGGRGEAYTEIIGRNKNKF